MQPYIQDIRSSTSTVVMKSQNVPSILTTIIVPWTHTHALVTWIQYLNHFDLCKMKCYEVELKHSSYTQFE